MSDSALARPSKPGMAGELVNPGYLLVCCANCTVADIQSTTPVLMVGWLSDAATVWSAVVCLWECALCPPLPVLCCRSRESFKGLGGYYRLALPSTMMVCLEWWACERCPAAPSCRCNPCCRVPCFSATVNVNGARLLVALCHIFLMPLSSRLTSYPLRFSWCLQTSCAFSWLAGCRSPPCTCLPWV